MGLEVRQVGAARDGATRGLRGVLATDGGRLHLLLNTPPVVPL